MGGLNNRSRNHDKHHSDARDALPNARQHGRESLGDKGSEPMECLHYALNLPTSVVITGIDSMAILDQAHAKQCGRFAR